MTRLTPKIGFIGFGEVAYHMASGFHEAGLRDKVAYCRGPKNKPPYTEAFRQRARTVGVELVPTLEDVVKRSDCIFSLVTGVVSLEVARQVAPFLDPRILYVDANNSPPQAKEMAALAVNARGARFVDAMLIGAAQVKKHQVLIWASGDGAEEFKTAMSQYGMNIELISEKAGAASMLKSIWEVLTKGFQGLLWEMLLAAHKAGIDLKAHPYPSIETGAEPINFTIPEYLVWHSGIHAARKAGELRLVGEELRRLGIEPIVTEAASERLAKLAEFNLKEQFGEKPVPEASRVMTEAIERRRAPGKLA